MGNMLRQNEMTVCGSLCRAISSTLSTQVNSETVCIHSMHLHQETLVTQSEDGSCVTHGQNQRVDIGEDSHAVGFTRELKLLGNGLDEVGTTVRQPATRFL